MTNRKMFKFSE